MAKVKNHYHYSLIYLLAFLLAISDALASYTQSSFLKQFFSLSNIGLIIVLASAATIIISIWLPKLINRLSVYHATLWLSGLAVWCSAMLVLARTPWLVATLFILRYLIFIFLVVALDIFLEKISQDKTTGFVRSVYLTAINIAWLSSPWLMSQIVGDNDYAQVYWIGTLIMAGFLLLLLFSYKKLKSVKTDATLKNIDLKSSVKKIFASRNLLGVFSAVIALNIFYALAVLYMPIYLNISLGFSWPTIGLIFTVMLLPFVLLQIPAGWLADKYFGEKEMLIIGNLLMAASSLVICFTDNKQIIFWAILLFISRIGAALAEVMQEVYFYKQVSVKNVSLINLFRQSRTLGWLIGAFLAFVLLKFMNIQEMFFVIVVIMSLNVLQLTFIKDTK